MPRNLIRYQESGDLHFITFSCFGRKPYLNAAETRDQFQKSLELMRLRYNFWITGYVVMPEHVHLLVGEPTGVLLNKVVQALKLSISAKQSERPFWQERYYDFNVYTEKKRVEKLRYMHRNPIKRGLVSKPWDWPWSSFRHYLTGYVGTVEIESEWTATRRERATPESHVSKARRGAPIFSSE